MIGTLRLSDLEPCLAGQLAGGDVAFSAVSTDTRELQPGALFVALRGENFDGNSFAQQAQGRGAAAVVVSAEQPVSVPQLIVSDTEKALGCLGHLNRQRSGATVVAVTGSQGKTSVKEMVGRILGQSFRVLMTRGNLNNTIGVPLTLLQLDASHERAVVELGANAQGEIARTAQITAPHIVLINNAAETHLEGFGSLAGVVEAKGEIIDSSATTHTVVLNADDPNVDAWRKRAGARRCSLFSMAGNPAAAYQAVNVTVSASGAQFTLRSPAGDVECQLALVGLHNVANAVAAAALALEAGASLQDVRDGLAAMQPVPGRLTPRAGIHGSRLLDDSYNASPSSFQAAIDVLAALGAETVLIMGDMGELGADNVDAAHREVGRYARDKGVSRVWATGPQSRAAVEAFGAGGRHFENKQSLIEYALQHLGTDMVTLVKGSRSAAMDEVSNRLQDGENN